MKTMRFPPSAGDRFVQRTDAGVSTALTLERIATPENLSDDRHFVFRTSVGGPEFKYSASTLAGMLTRGALISADPFVEGLAPDTRTNNLVDWGGLKVTRVTEVKRRLAYVNGLSNLASSLSFKSREFRAVVEAIAQGRGEPPPHPTSVYRWTLRWRRSGNSVAALAMEVAANRHRTQRKPLGNQLANAFLKARLSRVERTPLTELYDQYLVVHQKATPATIDAQVEMLMQQADANANAHRIRQRARAKVAKKRNSKGSRK